MIGDLVAGEIVLLEQVANLFDFDELTELGVVEHVDLVQEDDDVRNADLAGEEDVLARLGHRAVSGPLTTRIAPSICAAPVIMFFT